MKSANTKPDQIANTTTNVPNSAIPNIPNNSNITFLSLIDYYNLKRLTNTSQALLLFN